MSARETLAPGVPEDYYCRISESEWAHFWYRGMWEMGAVLLGDRLQSARLLDAGCGTGGFLRFALERGAKHVAGADIASTAIELAHAQVPDAALCVAPLHELPFPDASFELVVSNDVLQHVPELEVGESLLELGRVLVPGGALLLRTNGSRHLRRERHDWRAYDAATLRNELVDAGFEIERLTYANAVLSLLAAVLGRVPHAPSVEHHGIPTRRPRRPVSALGRITLSGEARWLRRGRTLPYGHTLFALAVHP